MKTRNILAFLIMIIPQILILSYYPPVKGNWFEVIVFVLTPVALIMAIRPLRNLYLIVSTLWLTYFIVRSLVEGITRLIGHTEMNMGLVALVIISIVMLTFFVVLVYSFYRDHSNDIKAGK